MRIASDYHKKEKKTEKLRVIIRDWSDIEENFLNKHLVLPVRTYSIKVS